ncbi:site-specific DNA-methyltransferase, partial [Salmonella enterica subsp. diarizonae serovar (6),14:z10:z]
ILYCVDNGKLFCCFYPCISVSYTEFIAAEITKYHQKIKANIDTVCYFLDSSFENNAAKTNLCAILEQHGLTNLRCI